MTAKQANDRLAELILELEELEDSTLTSFCVDLWKIHAVWSTQLQKK